MNPDRAADRHPPLPARFKPGTRDARTLVDVDDAPTPAKAVVLSESSDLSELRGQLQALTIAVRDLRDEMRLSRSARADRASAPTSARAQPASRSIGAKIRGAVVRLVLVLAIASAVAAALMLFLAGPAFG
jgi:hypothetical protein